MSHWGLLPSDVISQLKLREWENTRNLRQRLSGERAFPLRTTLKPPTAQKALKDLEHFQRFIKAWRNWPHSQQLEWQTKKFQHLGEQQVPVALIIDSMPELINLLGVKAKLRSQHWEQLMQPLLKLDMRLSPILIRHLARLETMTPDESALMAKLLPQLSQGMGQGGYLRSLQIVEVDTKFVENHQGLIADLLDCLQQNSVTEAGGLLAWLNCVNNPSGWLWVRPLCEASQHRLAGLPILRMDSQTLLHYSMPANRILIVENIETGFALPKLEDTIAIFGGGANTAWMQAQWLLEKHIGYWGDIDSAGLSFLSNARLHQPKLHALMMNEATVVKHQARMVDEAKHVESMPVNLEHSEQQLFESLVSGYFDKTRLEQERLTADYIAENLVQWHQAGS